MKALPQPKRAEDDRRTATKASGDNRNTMHHALGPFMVLSQFLGTLPVAGVWPSANIAHVHFSWCTPAVVVSFALLGFCSIDFVLSTKVVLERGLKLYTVGPLSFSVICVSSLSVFMQLARNWPNLIKQTHRCEQIFLQRSYRSRESRNYSHHIRVWGAVLLLSAAVEHSVYIISAVYNNYVQIKECNLTVDFWQNYFMRERLQIFSIVNYNAWLIPLVVWITVSTTFTWNFVDIFIILVSRGVSMRFRQMHWRIARHVNERMRGDFWQELRYDYMTLTEYLRLYDNKLSGLILLSCVNNLYFICVQIFHSFNNKGSSMNEIYFWSSLIFVLARFLTMMLNAAAVYEETNRITATMYEIPTAFWSLELKRLNEIIASDMISFSGRGFFYLTRRLVFGMASTIVVYELVLLDQVQNEDHITDFCTARNV